MAFRHGKLFLIPLENGHVSPSEEPRMKGLGWMAGCPQIMGQRELYKILWSQMERNDPSGHSEWERFCPHRGTLCIAMETCCLIKMMVSRNYREVYFSTTVKSKDTTLEKAVCCLEIWFDSGSSQNEAAKEDLPDPRTLLLCGILTLLVISLRITPGLWRKLSLVLKEE